MMRYQDPTPDLSWPAVCLAFGKRVGCDKLSVVMRRALCLQTMGRDIRVGVR
jgi:hypothetical protein